MGDLLRAEVAAGTPAGQKAKSYMDNGDLVPNEVGAAWGKGWDVGDVGAASGYVRHGQRRPHAQQGPRPNRSIQLLPGRWWWRWLVRLRSCCPNRPTHAFFSLQVVVEMVKNKLAEPEVQAKGWLLDGYPRRCAWVGAWLWAGRWARDGGGLPGA